MKGLSTHKTKKSIMPRLAIILGGLTLVSLTAIIGAAYYFDRKRATDPLLRKKIKKEKKAATTKKTQDPATSTSATGTEEREETAISTAKQLLAVSLDTVFKQSATEREQHFVLLLMKGEELLEYGTRHMDLAVCLFFRAMKLLPNPTELIVNLQKVLPEPVFAALIKLISEEGTKKIMEYFANLPPAGAPVRVLPSELTNIKGEKEQTWALAATKDLAVNERVYVELPDVAASLALAAGPEASQTSCERCLADLSGATDVCGPCGLVYCSQSCLEAARATYLGFLCPSSTDGSAFARLLAHCRANACFYPVLVAKYLALLSHEDAKAVASEGVGGAFMHFEFLRPMLLPVTSAVKQEAALVRQIFEDAKTGFAEFLTDERYVSVKGSLMYNCIGVRALSSASLDHASPTLDSVPPPASSLGQSFKDVVRHSLPMEALKGLGLYHFSCHLAHSCDPNCDLQNVSGNHELSIITRRAIKQGEQLTISYLPLQHLSSAEARKALLRESFFFECACSKCLQE